MGLIGVFVIANGAIIAQMDASLEAIDASDDPSPSIRFRNANLNEDAILSFAINANGTGYLGGGSITAVGSTGTGGFEFLASYTVSGGGVDTVTIEANGFDYTGTITITLSGDSGATPAGVTFKDIVLGNALFANLTNDGSTSIDVDDMWVSVNGDEPVELTGIESSTTFGTFFPGETISIIFLEGGLANSVNSISVTANGAVASFGV